MKKQVKNEELASSNTLIFSLNTISLLLTFPNFLPKSPFSTFFSLCVRCIQTSVIVHFDVLPTNRPTRKSSYKQKEVGALFLLFGIRFSGWERKQPGGMYCVRTVGAASALRARLLRSYVPLRRDRVKTCAITIHTSRRTLSQSDKYEVYTPLLNSQNEYAAGTPAQITTITMSAASVP